MAKKIITGIIIGAIAGCIDLIPMIIRHLPLNADLSAFSLWLMVGVLTPMLSIKLPWTIKSIMVAFMILIPSAFIIGWDEPITLLPIAGMTLILGFLVGIAFSFIFQKIINHT